MHVSGQRGAQVKLWIFSNVGYGFGEDILAEAARVAEKLGMESRIVISTRNCGRKYNSDRSIKNIFMFSIVRMAFKLQAMRRLRRIPIFVDDVNADNFRQAILPDDIGMIAGFEQIFKAPLIQRFRMLVNFHPSLLPLYRGASPSDWCLANKEKMTGFTVHHVTELIDAGDILYQQAVPIEESDSAYSLDRKISAASLPWVAPIVQHLTGVVPMVCTRLDPYRIYTTHMDYVRPTKPGTS